MLRGAARLPPLVFSCAKNRAGRHRFGFSLHPRSRFAPAPARRLRGRTTFPLPAPFPFSACGAQVMRTAFLILVASTRSPSLRHRPCEGTYLSSGWANVFGRGQSLTKKATGNRVRRSLRAERGVHGIGFAETTLDELFDAGKWQQLQGASG
jgi:hypothetical protein